jgi:hypothetical protein
MSKGKNQEPIFFTKHAGGSTRLKLAFPPSVFLFEVPPHPLIIEMDTAGYIQFLQSL